MNFSLVKSSGKNEIIVIISIFQTYCEEVKGN
jgi:hypothetical protein